ncbi:MAG: hypothetical protein MK116_08645 [Phycisphaerales bacterium]|nr:hypothetical protein [Phycisphaerales bacterium]
MSLMNQVVVGVVTSLLCIGVTQGAGEIADCNSNNVDDAIDIAQGTSTDCDGDLVPDECQNDCDEDGIPDSCEILQGAADQDGDGLPDDCEADCNDNDIADFLDIEYGIEEDCDGNGVPDSCDYSAQQILTAESPYADFGRLTAMDGEYLAVASASEISIYRVADSELASVDVLPITGVDHIDLVGTELVVGCAIERKVKFFTMDASSGQWSQSGEIHEPSIEYFGRRVSLDGDQLAVGPATNGYARPLRVYDRGTDGQWAGVTVDSPTLSSGGVIALSDDTLAYGGRGNQLNVYTKDGSGDWSLALSIENAPWGGVDLSGDWMAAYTQPYIIICERALNGTWGVKQYIDSGNIKHPVSVDMSGGRVVFLGNSSSNYLYDSYYLQVFELQPNRTWMMSQEFRMPDVIYTDDRAPVQFDQSTVIVGASDDFHHHGLAGGDGSVVSFDAKLDCNGNGVPDSCDFDNGTSLDIDGDQRPDECQCLCDVNQSGHIDVDDVLLILSNWGGTGPLADVNYDGVVGVNDILALLSAWDSC